MNVTARNDPVTRSKASLSGFMEVAMAMSAVSSDCWLSRWRARPSAGIGIVSAIVAGATADSASGLAVAGALAVAGSFRWPLAARRTVGAVTMPSSIASMSIA